MLIPTTSRPGPIARLRIRILAIQRFLVPGTTPGDDVATRGRGAPPTLDWLYENASEADDKAASMLVSVDPLAEVVREGSRTEGVSGRGCGCVCRARNAFGYGESSLHITDVRVFHELVRPAVDLIEYCIRGASAVGVVPMG